MPDQKTLKWVVLEGTDKWPVLFLRTCSKVYYMQLHCVNPESESFQWVFLCLSGQECFEDIAQLSLSCPLITSVDGSARSPQHAALRFYQRLLSQAPLLPLSHPLFLSLSVHLVQSG